VKRAAEDGAGHRHARLQELIRALLRDDVSDPALGDVWVTAVVLSVDYRHARVHYTMTGVAVEDPKMRAERESAFTRATPFLRSELALTIDLKRVPDLRFVTDGG